MSTPLIDPPAPLDDVIDLGGMAPLFGVGERTPHIWRYRTVAGEMGEHPLPDPDDTKGGAPLWRRSRIIAWGAVTGRPMHGLTEAERQLVERLTTPRVAKALAGE